MYVLIILENKPTMSIICVGNEEKYKQIGNNNNNKKPLHIARF